MLESASHAACARIPTYPLDVVRCPLHSHGAKLYLFVVVQVGPVLPQRPRQTGEPYVLTCLREVQISGIFVEVFFFYVPKDDILAVRVLLEVRAIRVLLDLRHTGCGMARGRLSFGRGDGVKDATVDVPLNLLKENVVDEVKSAYVMKSAPPKSGAIHSTRCGRR